LDSETDFVAVVHGGTVLDTLCFCMTEEQDWFFCSTRAEKESSTIMCRFGWALLALMIESV
jgi:hypothetical protein